MLESKVPARRTDDFVRVNTLLQDLTIVLFNELLDVPREHAVLDGFRVFKLFGFAAATDSYSLRGCVEYRLGELHVWAERLYVKCFCWTTEANQQAAIDDVGLQLHAEMYFYQQVVPLFGAMRGVHYLVPEFRVGRVESAAGHSVGAIVFRNVDHYRHLRRAEFMDQPMLLVALRKIAEFHAYSFRARRENRSFRPAVSHSVHTEHMDRVADTLRRCLLPLVNDDEFAAWVPRLWNLVDNLAVRVEQPLMQQSGDGCVLCHRNYNRANILFRFNDRTKMATNVRIVNWQWMGFASLGVDLVMLLFVETHPQTRREHWKQLLQEYNKTLYSTFEDEFVPDYERILAEIKASVPVALYMLGLRANRLHLQTTSRAAINVSPLLWNERLITEVFKELIRRDLV